ncbi:MAG: serine hydrolase domain-containing protein [Gemmataceae bacterium]
MFRSRLQLFAFLTAILSISSHATAQSLSDQEFQKLRDRVQAKIDELRSKADFPGVSVGFALADGRSAGVASGLADVESKRALKPSDRLLAGSVGKTFVAALMLQLIEEKKLDLDDPLSKWIGREPWFNRLPNGQDITLRSLLNHTSGLKEYFEAKGFAETLKAHPEKVWTPAERLAFVLDVKPLFAVGKGWSYADTNYILVGLVAERVTGKPLFEEIERRLLKPLKLTCVTPSDRQEIPGLVAGFADPRLPLGFKGKMLSGSKMVVNPQVEWAGGGLATTSEDLARWAKILFECGTFEKKATREAMLTGVDTGSGRGGGRKSRYGLGVQIRDSEWGPSYGHGGWFPGYLTEMVYYPEKKIAVAVQFNTDAGPSLKKGPPAYAGDIVRVILEEKK